MKQCVHPMNPMPLLSVRIKCNEDTKRFNSLYSNKLYIDML